MINISLVGIGYWGSNILRELRQVDGVGDIEEIDIKDGKDIDSVTHDNVILATPAWDHKDQVIRLLNQGKNLYVEKPLALTCTDCCIIKSFLRDETLMVGHIFLYNDRVKKIKELLPRIGNIQYIESNRLNWGRFQKKITTLDSLATHDISMIHYFLGEHEFRNVKHSGHKFSKFEQNDRDEFEFTCNNIPIKFNMSWYYPDKQRTTVIIGDKGTIFWDEQTKVIRLQTNIWEGDRMNYQPTVEEFKIDCNPLRNELQHFVDCVRNNTKPTTDVDNAIAVAKNLDLLTKSFAQYS